MFHHDLRHTGRCATSQTTIDLLIEHLKALNLNNGIENSFDAKLDAAQRALDDLNQNDNAAACGSLEAFINEVEAQRGKKISEVEAEELIYEAEQIIAMICG